jgi:hypothetical protein
MTKTSRVSRLPDAELQLHGYYATLVEGATYCITQPDDGDLSVLRF